MSKRRNHRAEVGRGRYTPPTRRGAHGEVNAESDRPRLHPAAALTGAGLLATTGLFGLGMLTTSASGAVSPPAGAHAGFGDAVGNPSVAGFNGVAIGGTQNPASGQTANGNSSPLATPADTTPVGTFGIGSKTTSISTQASASPWKVLDGLVTFTAKLTSDDDGVSGQTITFALNGVRGVSCQAVTSSSGFAQCTVVVRPLVVLLRLNSYTASYDGNATFAPSSENGTINVRFGNG